MEWLKRDRIGPMPLRKKGTFALVFALLMDLWTMMSWGFSEGMGALAWSLLEAPVMLLGLMAAGQARSSAVERGIEFLLRNQRPDGGWEDVLWNGTGFPRVFYLQYHLYAHYFPLWALGIWRRATR